MDLKSILNFRYSTKEFDPIKKISKDHIEQIKALLQMSPSSINLQPWHFIIAHTKEGKERVAKGTEGFFQFNKPKITDASHVIVFTSRIDADENYMQHLLDQEEKDGRFPNDEIKESVNSARNLFANIHRYDTKDFQHWMEKQVYLNMGNLLLGVAALGIDAVPMEGVDLKAIDEEFSLREKGFTSLAVVSLGYRKDSDFNAKAPKSRLPQEEILSLV
ncbi:MAG: oxygen-insensitive NAD(P)H nitroreductase [Reichenbachiella sp.]|uniref:oxygen-insensitive NAD(P)H nitroreductase n=1 Tax=Reichenbachiella sp. TaxID=2184521 RepID=UPI003299C432